MIVNLYQDTSVSSNNMIRKEFKNNSSFDEQINNVVYINKSSRISTLNNSSPKDKIKDTTSVVSTEKFSEQEFINNIKQIYLEDLVLQMTEISKKNYDYYKYRLKTSLNKYDYSHESLLLAEEVVQEVINKINYETLGRILQAICLEDYNKNNILCGICQCLERFDLDEVYPWGVTLMLSILQHKDENVKAYAISSIDNWADKSLLQVIKNIDCTSDWLKNYVFEVITRLEV